MDWLASALVMVSLWLICLKRWEGWAVGLVAQVVFFVINVRAELWGLMPLMVFSSLLHIMALLSWRRQD